MARFEFKLPDIGEGLAEAEVAKWLVSVGDSVVEDQPVLEMMTDKATVEIPAPKEVVHYCAPVRSIRAGEVHDLRIPVPYDMNGRTLAAWIGTSEAGGSGGR